MDPITFSYESTPDLWRCNYDPEGPQGFGKTKARALLELFSLCDDHHSEALLAGAIVAAIEKQGTTEDSSVTTPGNIGRGPNNMIWCEQCEAIKPIWIDDMDGCDVTAQFDHARDLMCGECRLVIATTYRRMNTVPVKDSTK